MPDTDSITIVKRFTYRGAQEEWSNTYHLDGTTPTSDAAWRALAVAIHASEKTCYVADVKLVTAYGYEAGNEHSVSQQDFLTGSNALQPGTLATGSTTFPMSGDQAYWVRALVGVSSTGKKVYVRKYFHGGLTLDTNPDAVHPSARTAALAHATLMLSGSLPGGMKWVAPQGATPTLPTVGQWVTTRTLKRRGKRPS